MFSTGDILSGWSCPKIDLTYIPEVAQVQVQLHPAATGVKASFFLGIVRAQIWKPQSGLDQEQKHVTFQPQLH